MTERVHEKETKEPNEFTHIEIKVIRNPEWLKQFERRGFYLSSEFPVESFKLPTCFEKMSESDIQYLRTYILASLNNRLEIISEDDLL